MTIIRALLVFNIILWITSALAFDETQLNKLKALNACIKCDLSAANLTGSNLIGANLTEANMQPSKDARLTLVGMPC